MNMGYATGVIKPLGEWQLVVLTAEVPLTDMRATITRLGQAFGDGDRFAGNVAAVVAMDMKPMWVGAGHVPSA